MNVKLRSSDVVASSAAYAGNHAEGASPDSGIGLAASSGYARRHAGMQHPAVPFVLFFADLLFFWICVAAAGMASWLFAGNGVEDLTLFMRMEGFWNSANICFCLSAGFCAWFAVMGAYTTRRPLEDDIKRLASVVATMAVIHVVLEAVSQSRPPYLWIVLLWPSVMLLVPWGRIIVRRVLDARGLWRIGAAVIGSGEHYPYVLDAIEKNKYLGYYPAYHSGLHAHRDLLLPDFANRLAEEMAAYGARTAILVPSATEIAGLDRVIDALNLRLKPYILVPPVQRLSFTGLTVQSTLASDAILMSSRHGLISPVRRAVKRIFDVVVSLFLLIFLAPALAVIALLVASSGRPILFGHERIGFGRKPFRCLKFRTMVVNSDEVLANLLTRDPVIAQEWRQNFKLANDPRITRVGKFLRETSLDELPQLINVLRGEMSLVGPRPVVAKEISLYYGDEAFYYELVRPGVTGLWQVSGRSQTSYARRVFLDSCYVRNWSLWTDLMILFSTIPSVLARDGAR